MEETTQDATIYLTDQVKGHPNIKGISREILFSVYDFYRKPDKANDFRKRTFTDYHRLAEDSAGFQILMGKFASMETLFKDFSVPARTVDIYKRIGITSNDLPIQLDIPPRYNLPKEETLAIVRRSAEFYHFMRAEIPEVIPVVHGWTLKELQQSLEWIEDPDRLASGTNIGPAYRSLDVMTKKLAAGTNKAGAGGSQYILDHITSNKSHVASGAFQAMTKEKQWVMGHLNPHSSIKDRIAAPGGDVGTIVIDHINKKKAVATGAYQQSGEFVCNGIANTPERMKQKAIAAGAMAQSPVVVDHVVSSKPKVIAAGANQQSGRYVLNEAGNLKIVAAPAASAEEIITTIDKANRKEKAGIPKKHRAPEKVVLERLALVLNMLRDRKLFILGGASSHFQHMIFMGGAQYTDTSSWRLKGYMGAIFLPEIGARSIGYKDTDKRLQKSEIPILRECLREPTNPANQMGFSVSEFLELGHMNVRGYYETVKEKKWPCKPFDLRALHNAWVLKCQEEPLANEYACDPDRYHRYLMNRRFKGHPNLTRRCKKLWSLLKRPSVQDTLDIYLKGRN